MNSSELAELQSWIGRRESLVDLLDPAPAARLAATLSVPDFPAEPGMDLPPLWHWAYFLAAIPTLDLGDDGHPRRGGFLPPVPLPRRMWAGGRLEFWRPLRLGERVERISTIDDVSLKRGRSGELVFVLVRHEFFGPDGLALVEEHDIVYREAPPAVADTEAELPPELALDASGDPPPDPDPATDAARKPPARTARWRRVVTPTPVLLFRYSALTFNGHRIHYDADYCRNVEGYPGLVVHGPLLATCLLGLLREAHPAAGVARFAFRARRPLFAPEPFLVCGSDDGQHGAQLWIEDAAGEVVMTAEATFA